MRYYTRVLVILATIGITLALILFNAGCKSSPQAQPYVPPQYLNSLEVLPGELAKAYEGEYGDYTAANTVFKDNSLVFKDIKLTAEMLETAYKGYIWIEGVKVEFDNPEEWDQLKKGSKVDIAGFCQGRDWYEETPYVTLAQSIFFPAGTVDLAAGGGGFTVPIY